MPRKKRLHLTPSNKAEIIRLFDSGETKKALCARFQLSEHYFRKIIREKDRTINFVQDLANPSCKIISPRHPTELAHLEERLYQYILEQNRKNREIRDMDVRAKALLLRDAIQKQIKIKFDCKFSDGWMEKFKKRFNIKSYKMCGDAADVDMTIVETFRSKLDKLKKDKGNFENFG